MTTWTRPELSPLEPVPPTTQLINVKLADVPGNCATCGEPARDECTNCGEKTCEEHMELWVFTDAYNPLRDPPKVALTLCRSCHRFTTEAINRMKRLIEERGVEAANRYIEEILVKGKELGDVDPCP